LAARVEIPLNTHCQISRFAVGIAKLCFPEIPSGDGANAGNSGKTMTHIRNFFVMIVKAAVVTLAAVLGFGAGGMLGLPVWLHGFFLIPAILLFYRLAGETRPPIWRLIGFSCILTILVLLATLGMKYLPDHEFTVYLFIVVLFAPFTPILNWFERRFFSEKNGSGQVGTSNDG